MQDDIANLIVTDDCSVRVAFEKLQNSARGILLLVNSDGRLRRTISDGDLRRLLLAGNDMDDSVAGLPEQPPKVIQTPAQSADALAIMSAAKVDQLPVVDEDNRPVTVLLRRDLDSQILLSTPHLGTEEMSFIQDAIRSNWIAPLGPNVDAFENELADYVGIGHAAALSSGTAAIHLALRLLDIGPGDRVFCSTLTFVASANPILYQGATPVFIDSDRSSWNMSPQALRRALEQSAKTNRLPRAVIVVSLYGQSADLDMLLAICNEYQVPLIEDAAESLGATYRKRHSGTMGLMGIYSFNGNKIITTSGGGMLVSDDPDLIVRARHLATQARASAPWYEHNEVGYNYRMSNILAGIGRGQLRVLEQRVSARRHVFDYFRDHLADLGGIEWMPEADYGRCTRWLTAGILPECIDPADFIAALSAHRIEARRVWKPMHMQPLFVDAEYHLHDEDVSRDLFERGVCLPSGSNMSQNDLERIVAAIRDTLQ